MIKEAVKYQVIKFRKVIMIYYASMFVILMMLAYNLLGGGVMPGMEGITLSFIFVMIISSFKENLRMFLQNGLSRKSVFYSYIISITGVVMIMGFISTGMNIILNRYFNYDSVQNSMAYVGNNPILKVITGFIFITVIYMIMAMTALFMIIHYYRMSTKVRVTVYVGVPILFIGIVILSAEYPENMVIQRITEFMVAALDSTSTTNTYWFNTVKLIILGTLSYHLIKKITVQKGDK